MMRAVFVEGTAEQVFSVINEFFRKSVIGGEEWSGGVLNSGVPVERQAMAGGQLRAAVEYQEHVEVDVKPVKEVKPLTEWQPVELQEDVKRDIIPPSAPAPSSSSSSYRQHATDVKNAINNAMGNVYPCPSVTSSTPRRKRPHYRLHGVADGQGRRMICSKNTRRCQNCGMNTRTFSAFESHICLGDAFRCPEIGCTFNSKSQHGLTVHKRRMHPVQMELKLKDLTYYNPSQSMGSTLERSNTTVPSLPPIPMPVRGSYYIDSPVAVTPLMQPAGLMWPQALLTNEAKPLMTPEQLGGATLPVDEGVLPIENCCAYYGAGGGGRGGGSPGNGHN
ncbi:uncharacterized protein [Drosophila kikkawai]|uniref:C2H2-type domain-containing protein n=1 Tax=Drosophila kikkawai TaxID=30033 RepID=A0A6P4JQV2_DROKI|nr:uncharacterized protein LOC108085080 [Drosophila kikkawai]